MYDLRTRALWYDVLVPLREDREEFDRGFARGDYAQAYENPSDVYPIPCGESGFYRIGHLLGWYATFENHEVLDEHQECVTNERVKFGAWL